MAQQNAPIRLNPADETIQVGVTQIRFPVTGAESNGSVAILELTIPALPHSHNAYEETIYGLEGISTWTVSRWRDNRVSTWAGHVHPTGRGPWIL